MEASISTSTTHVAAGRKGGFARAANTTDAERREQAREAAEARWGRHVPRETHAGSLDIGGVQIECAVLSNGQRVLSRRAVGRAMGAKKTGANKQYGVGPSRPAFISSKRFSPFVSDELGLILQAPIRYRPMAGGRVAFGYEATVLPDLCQVVIEAHRAGIVDSRQSYLVERAETLLLAFAKVGVIALVDEATGYQEERDRQELRRIFEAYISEDLRPWTKRFPDGFFEEIYRLHNWRYEPGNAQRPAYVGKLINRYVYERLPVGVLEALRVRNPTNVAGRRRHRHHQYLTTNTGDPHLDNQIQKVWTLLQASESMSQFDRMIRRVFQLVGDQIEMDGLDVPD